MNAKQRRRMQDKREECKKKEKIKRRMQDKREEWETYHISPWHRSDIPAASGHTGLVLEYIFKEGLVTRIDVKGQTRKKQNEIIETIFQITMI